MAKIRNGVLTGLVGNLVLTKHKDVQVVKARPQYKAQPTAGQKSQRNKLFVVNEFLKGIKPVIRVGYQDSDKLSPYNECVSDLLKNVIKLDNGNQVLDYPAVKISRGKLTAPEITSVEIETNRITISWNGISSGSASRKNDEAFVLLYPESEKPQFFECIGYRKDGTGSVDVSSAGSSAYHVWMFFSNPRLLASESKKKVSDSVYLGKF